MKIISSLLVVYAFFFAPDVAGSIQVLTVHTNETIQYRISSSQTKQVVWYISKEKEPRILHEYRVWLYGTNKSPDRFILKDGNIKHYGPSNYNKDTKKKTWDAQVHNFQQVLINPKVFAGDWEKGAKTMDSLVNHLQKKK